MEMMYFLLNLKANIKSHYSVSHTHTLDTDTCHKNERDRLADQQTVKSKTKIRGTD